MRTLMPSATPPDRIRAIAGLVSLFRDSIISASACAALPAACRRRALALRAVQCHFEFNI
jgi:hypothetical protein